ncbi:MAG: hypothetical protein GY839_12805 [candidate division Zixibacteria bacterium]|nr:hypothetical protein [candidate division Zixibacteria bacterium]
MKKAVLTLIAILLCISFAAAESNRCSFGNFHRINSDQFSVAIKIANHDTLGGFQVPFSFDNDDVEMSCDSVSFIDSRCGHFDFLNAKIDNESKSLLVMGIYQTNPAVEATPLLPGNGMVARAYYTITSANGGGNGNARRNIRFAKKKFRMTDNTMDFSFWTVDGETTSSIYENDVIDIDSE